MKVHYELEDKYGYHKNLVVKQGCGVYRIYSIMKVHYELDEKYGYHTNFGG